MKETAKAAASMICPDCKIECRRFGKHRNGLQRFRCADCGKTYTEEHEKPLGAMTVPIEKALLVLTMLIEGTSVRATERITGIHRDTICKLLTLAGDKCERIMSENVRNVVVRDVECDEVWSFIAKKQKRVRPEDDVNLGDAYCFVAIERNTKLVLNIALGKRDQHTTNAFIEGFIRRINFSDRTEKGHHDKIVLLVERMLTLAKRVQSGKLAPSEIDRIDREIAATDSDIDTLVFDLYGIAKNEQNIISETVTIPSRADFARKMADFPSTHL